jgi:hypothetical protein
LTLSGASLGGIVIEPDATIMMRYCLLDAQ